MEENRVELAKNKLICAKFTLLYSTLLSLPFPQSKRTISVCVYIYTLTQSRRHKIQVNDNVIPLNQVVIEAKKVLIPI